MHDQLKKHIKVYPDDFIVEEVANIDLSGGPYSIYWLEKTNRNTMEVIYELARLWNISLKDFGFAGLKDKHARTYQYISIKKGPKKDAYGKRWRLRFIGRSGSPLEIGKAAGNIFTITLREINVKTVEDALDFIKYHGFANYFGEQRFNADIYASEPIAKMLIRGDYRRALEEYFLKGPNIFARKRFRKLWGKWDLFLNEARHLSPQEKNVIRVLKRKKDFEKAFRAFPKNIKLMFFFSYQSRLWNRILRYLVEKFADSFRVSFVVDGYISFYKNVYNSKLLTLDIPYISKEVLGKWGDKDLSDAINKVIREENLTRSDIESEVSGLSVFSPGKRKAVVFPDDLKIIKKGRKSLKIRFFLPSGSYATVMLRKALFFKP